MDIFEVTLSKQALKDLEKVPSCIYVKLQAWIDDIRYSGLREVRKIPGYHDEPLKGKRTGQRSIRLSKHYRAIYIIDDSNTIHFIKIVEINKHDY
jgi:toxin HigB-1